MKAEQELQETQGRLQAFAEHSRDMIYLVRLQPNRRYEYVSPASTEIYGYTPEEFYADSKLLLKIVHPESRAALRQRRKARVSKQELTDTLPKRFFKKNGSIVWVETQAVAIRDEGGTIVAVEAVTRDVTER